MTTPNRIDYLLFIRNTMGISTTVLPDNSTDIDTSLSVALEICDNYYLPTVSSIIYNLAVYNLAGSNLIEFATDQPGQTYFADLRKTWDITGFVGGIISASNDESTGQTLLTPEFLKTLQISDLQYLKNPYGRQYLAYAQRIAYNWGIS